MIVADWETSIFNSYTLEIMQSKQTSISGVSIHIITSHKRLGWTVRLERESIGLFKFVVNQKWNIGDMKTSHITISHEQTKENSKSDFYGVLRFLAVTDLYLVCGGMDFFKCIWIVKIIFAKIHTHARSLKKRGKDTHSLLKKASLPPFLRNTLDFSLCACKIMTWHDVKVEVGKFFLSFYMTTKYVLL